MKYFDPSIKNYIIRYEKILRGDSPDLIIPQPFRARKVMPHTRYYLVGCELVSSTTDDSPKDLDYYDLGLIYIHLSIYGNQKLLRYDILDSENNYTGIAMQYIEYFTIVRCDDNLNLSMLVDLSEEEIHNNELFLEFPDDNSARLYLEMKDGK